MVDTNRYSSIKDALEALERGVTAPDKRLRSPVAELRRHIEALAVLPAQVDELTQAQAQAFALLQGLASTAERLTTAIEVLQEQNRVLDEQNRVLHE